MTTDNSHSGHTRRTFLLTGVHFIELGLAAVLTPRLSFANETQQARAPLSALSAQQELRAKQLEGKLIAPCCFSQTVANHYSDVAASIKRQIRQFLAQGQTEDQILDAYVRVYGERILAEPRASGFNLTAYLAPPLALLAGIGGMAFLFTQWRRTESKQPKLQQDLMLSHDETTSRLRTRLRDELSRFDS